MVKIFPKIDKAYTRKLPGKFEFPWRKWVITKEAAIRCSTPGMDFEVTLKSTVQLLQFEKGKRGLRFSAYGKRRFRGYPSSSVANRQPYWLRK